MLKFRIGPSCLLIWLMILCVSGLALAQPVVTAPSAILIEANGGQVLWEKNGDDRRHMASITKIMTMLLILEAMENGQFGLDDMVTVSENAKRQGGSQIWLEVGGSDERKRSLVLCGCRFCQRLCSGSGRVPQRIGGRFCGEDER